MISTKINSKNRQPRGKNVQKQLFELSTHPSAENTKNMFFVKILSFFENSHKNSILRAHFEFFCSFFLKIKQKVVCAGEQEISKGFEISQYALQMLLEMKIFKKLSF